MELEKLLMVSSSSSGALLMRSVIEPARREFEDIARRIEGSGVRIVWSLPDDPKCLPMISTYSTLTAQSVNANQRLPADSFNAESSIQKTNINSYASVEESNNIQSFPQKPNDAAGNSTLPRRMMDMGDDAMQELEARELARTPPSSGGATHASSFSQAIRSTLSEKFAESSNRSNRTSPSQHLPLPFPQEQNSQDGAVFVQGHDDKNVVKALVHGGYGAPLAVANAVVGQTWVGFGDDEDLESESEFVQDSGSISPIESALFFQALHKSPSPQSSHALDADIAEDDSSNGDANNAAEDGDYVAEAAGNYESDISTPDDESKSNSFLADNRSVTDSPVHASYGSNKKSGSHEGDAEHQRMAANSKQETPPTQALMPLAQVVSDSSDDVVLTNEEDRERKRRELEMELEWAKHALESRKEYLRAKKGGSDKADDSL